MIHKKILKYGLSIFFLLFLKGTAMPNVFDDNKCTTERVLAGMSQGALPDEIIGNELNMLTPNHLQLIEKAFKADSRLDSIYMDEKLGYNLEKRKWFFTYENDRLLTREKCDFGVSYNIPLYHTLRWTYNENLDLVLYEEMERISEIADTIIVTDGIRYLYNNSLLTQTIDKRIQGFSYGYRITETDTSYHYSIDYSEGSTFYKYDENKKLLQEYFNVSHSTTGDSIYNSIDYRYNLDGLLEYILYIERGNVLNVIKYEYPEPGNEQGFEIIEKVKGGNGFVIKNWESFTDWDYQVNYKLLRDTQGRDSILTNTRDYSEKRKHLNRELSITYYYNERDQLEKATYVIYNHTLGDDEWYKTAKVAKANYEYDDKGRLAYYEKLFYDLQYNSWEVQEAHTYFYNPLKSTPLENHVLKNKLIVFPNPATNIISVKGVSNDNIKYEIMNLFGITIQKGCLTTNTIDVSGLKQGTYLLKIVGSGEIKVCRFIKK